MIGSAVASRSDLDRHYDGVSASIERTLHVVRRYLNMDVSFVSEFLDGQRIFRHVDAERQGGPVRPGFSSSLEGSYCQRIVTGELPGVIADTARHAIAATLPATSQMPIGAHISVPLTMADGRIYGTFCCFSHDARPTLDGSDLALMNVFAEMIGQQLETSLTDARDCADKHSRILAVMDEGGPSMVYQPVFRLRGHEIYGAEALARFAQPPIRSPDLWFAEAATVGLQADLEIQAISRALAGFKSVWRQAPLKLKLNVSPRTIMTGEVLAVLDRYPTDRCVLEITEHEYVDDYEALDRALKPLRARGVRIAVDDAGSGYASMRHILHLRPDVIKLDISLTRQLQTDRVKRALAASLVAFGTEIGSYVVAEGVETAEEMRVLEEIGVYAAQGYHLARPGPVESLISLLGQRSG